jgi:hypothetical protein
MRSFKLLFVVLQKRGRGTLFPNRNNYFTEANFMQVKTFLVFPSIPVTMSGVLVEG